MTTFHTWYHRSFEKITRKKYIGEKKGVRKNKACYWQEDGVWKNGREKTWGQPGLLIDRRGVWKNRKEAFIGKQGWILARR